MTTMTRYQTCNSNRFASANARGAAVGTRLLGAMLIAGAIIGAYEEFPALESPGKVIRRDLIYAGRAVSGMSWSMPRDRVRQIVFGYFSDYRASVDATGFPAYVTVTLRDLGRSVCRDAYEKAGRIDGEVVIAAEGQADAACHDRAAITWRIMP
jgi:hypothetical protein